MGKNIKKNEEEKTKKDVISEVKTEQKEKKGSSNIKSQWTPNWLTVTIIVIVAILFSVWAFTFDFRQPFAANTVDGTTVQKVSAQETGKVTTYEEFKQEVWKLLKLNLKPEELEKKINKLGEELYNSSFGEWEKWITDDEKWWLEPSVTETNTENLSVGREIPIGFTPDKNLIDIRDQINFPEIPNDLEPYKKFFDVKGVWGEPRGGFYFCYNDAFLDVDRLGNVQIPTFSCLTFTGEEMDLPGIGSLKDSNGGAVEANVINVWETPGEFVRAYLLHGYFMVGQVFDMSDMTFDKDGNPVYGKYTLESLATLRNHYLYHLTTVDKQGFNFIGQTGKATQADSVTYVCVIRWYDGSFRLVNSGQWIRGQ